jgi:regulator of sirC expression with transglutaminase-like and TPR domain
MDANQARQLFYQTVNQPDEQIDLARAALYIALEEEPTLDPEEYINALDVMAEEVMERLPDGRYPLRIIQTINEYLYKDLGFKGNQVDYYDPRNSFLNQVIERRTGIPISLSLVYLEIARRIDFPMLGVGMPGHFLIRPNIADTDIFVDAFNQGEILFSQDCFTKLTEIYGQPVPLRPEFLAPISPRKFLARMLSNLKIIYINQENVTGTLAAIERILLLYPDALSEMRDRGMIYYQLGRWTEARLDLENYLTNLPNSEDSGIIRKLLALMQP